MVSPMAQRSDSRLRSANPGTRALPINDLGSFNPPVGASLVPSVALDPALGRLVFLSPSYSQGPGAAAWSWNGKIWTTLAASGWPGSAEVLVTDADHGQLLLIGSPTPNNDAAIHVWTLRGSTWQQLDTSGAGG